MASDMLVKMARGMWEENRARWKKQGRYLEQWEVETPELRAYFIKLARAALMAIREPDEAMMRAVQHSTGYVQAEDFTAMIDAILADGDRG